MKNRKYTINLFLSLLCLWVSLLVWNTTVIASVVEKELPLQRGDYLSVEYIDMLKQTRSPITAGKHTDYRQYITIGYSAVYKQIYIRGMGSFHEGLEGLVTDKSLNIVSDKFGETPAKIKVLSRFEFSIAVEGKVLVYRYVGNLQNYIARNTVAGKYKDNKGGLYIFTEEGLATFPDRKFQYEVPTDLTMGFDQIFEIPIRRDGLKYGFKVVNNELQLFKIVGEFVDEPESIPFLTLTRIRDAKAE